MKVQVLGVDSRRRRRAGVLAGLVALAIAGAQAPAASGAPRAAALAPPPKPGAYTDTVELSAADNAGAAVAFSRLAFRDGANEVVLGRDDEFADSFASGGLQGQRPLLLTAAGELDARTALELDRLNPERVYLLGGERALGAEVEAAVGALGAIVQRVSGATRIETAVAVAEQVLPRAERAVLARAFPGAGEDASSNFVDAVVAGGWAAAEDAPVLLTGAGPISAATAGYLERSRIQTVHVVGGAAAVSAEAAVQLAALGIEIERVAGASRYDTGVAVAQARGVARRYVLVDTQAPGSWAAGFAAAAYSARFGAPILPVNPDELPEPVARLLASSEYRQGLVCAPGVPGGVCHRAAEAAGQVRRADASLALEAGTGLGEALAGTVTNPEGVRAIKVIGCGMKREVKPGSDGSFSVPVGASGCRLTVRIEHADGTAFDQAFSVEKDGVRERGGSSSGSSGDDAAGDGSDDDEDVADDADDAVDDALDGDGGSDEGSGGLGLGLPSLSGGDEEDEDAGDPEPDPTPSGGAGDPEPEPTEDPTEEPTADPTEEPTADPTEEPTAEPTEEPTADPTEEPTEEPTEKPTSGGGCGDMKVMRAGAYRAAIMLC